MCIRDRICHGRTGDGQQLALALAQAAAVPGDHRVIPLGQVADKAVGVGQLRCGADLLIRGVQLAVADVVGHGSGEQMGILQHNAQRTAQGVLCDVLHVDAVVGDNALLHVVEAVDEVGDGGLARTGRAHKGDLLPGFGEQGHIVEHRLFPVVGEGHVVKAHVAPQLHQRAVRLLPGPVAGAAVRLRQGIAVLQHPDQGGGAVVGFGVGVHHGENPLGAGHRRQKASELAGFVDMPCIVRDLTDEQAITQMVEDNTNQRENILPSERAKALKMQLEAIKHQGAKEATSGQLDPKDAGRRSNEIVAERNKMTVKQVQRYIKLNDLVPDLQKMMDAGQIKFTPAVELAYIKPKNQRYIAVAIEGQQSAPSLSQAQRMRELDQKGVLNGDVIDGIMMEDKKEVDKVILTGAELGKYFGKETTPREMKDQIIKLLDDWKGQQKEVAKPEKKAAQQEK